MNIAQQLARCNEQKVDGRRNNGGRPADPLSRRQRILAYLEESGPADNRTIAAAIGATVLSVRTATGELAREGQIVRAGKIANRVIWTTA